MGKYCNLAYGIQCEACTVENPTHDTCPYRLFPSPQDKVLSFCPNCDQRGIPIEKKPEFFRCRCGAIWHTRVTHYAEPKHSYAGYLKNLPSGTKVCDCPAPSLEVVHCHIKHKVDIVTIMCWNCRKTITIEYNGEIKIISRGTRASVPHTTLL